MRDRTILHNSIIKKHSIYEALVYSKLPNTCSYYTPSIEDIIHNKCTPAGYLDMRLDNENRIYEFFDLNNLVENCLGVLSKDEVIQALQVLNESYILFFENDIDSRYIHYGNIAQNETIAPKVDKSKVRDKSIYLIKDLILKKYKIGISKDPKGRLKTLQIATPNELTIVSTIPKCSFNDESRLHERFKHLNVRSEWFEFDEGIKNEFMRTNLGKDI